MRKRALYWHLATVIALTLAVPGLAIGAEDASIGSGFAELLLDVMALPWSVLLVRAQLTDGFWLGPLLLGASAAANALLIHLVLRPLFAGRKEPTEKS